MKKNVKNSVENVNNVVENNEVFEGTVFEGLEETTTAVETTSTMEGNPSGLNFGSIEWLRENSPIFPEEISSAKLNLEREPKVQAGADAISELSKEFNPLMLLLATWWENKEARKTIKKALDEEAVAKGYDTNHYMQDILRKEVEKWEGLQEVVNRMKYAITYFKPREGREKEQFKQYAIGNAIYNVSLRKLAELREQFGEDKKSIIAEIKKCSERISVADEL